MLNRFLSHSAKAGRNMSAREQSAMLDALDKSMAVIQFQVDGTIVSANANFLNAVGYEADEVIGQHHSMFVEPAFASSAEYADFWDALKRGEFQAAVYKRLGKGGREIWIQASYNPVLNSSGKAVKVVKYATDVTEETLRNADYSGQLAAISKSQAVIQFHLDGTIIDANENFLGAVGYALDEVQGKHHSIFVEADYKASAEYKQFWAALARGEYQAAEYKRIRKDSSEIWIQASYNPIFDPDGQPFKVVKYATDITGQVRAREEDAQAAAQLEANLEKILTSVGSASKESTAAATAANAAAQTVQTVAAATEEFEASTREISRSMDSSKSEVEKVMSEAAEVDQSTLKLAEAASSMGNIVQMIQEIAGQINLLALNATIESARAGEAGKGFAVVASEVKSLANQVAKATGEIDSEINGMQVIAEEVVSGLSGIKTSMDEVERSVATAAIAVEEQTGATYEMTGSMQTASSAVQDVNSGLTNIAKSVGELDEEGREMMNNLQREKAAI